MDGRNRFSRCFAFLRRQDPVLLASLVLAVGSSCLVPPSAAYLGYIDWRVLALLLSLMLVVAGLKEAGAFRLVTDRLLGLVHETRTLAAVLIGLCFFGSMLITNDVALITFVPLAVLLLIQIDAVPLLIPVIVLQTIAANLGSSLTPLGNPQNLYLYSLSGMTGLSFLRVMALPSILSLLMLSACLFWIKPRPIQVPASDLAPNTDRKSLLVWCGLFVFCLLAVLRILHYGIALAVVLAAVCILDRKLLAKADYGLLFTFVFFFIFIGNMKNIPAVSDMLAGLVAGREITVGILLSQLISNVPAAMLLSGFTQDYASLLLGVNIGGLGTLIASMASMISYKIYAGLPNAHKGRYLALFTLLNLAFLAVLWVVMAVVSL